MKKIPLWMKILGGVLLTALLFGGARLLLWFDQVGGSSKFGLD
ncbi:MAG TPA: hypothetical protein VJ576_22105 [Rhodocyclaceae bacterium]|nr:hypothetical protein [Rhodocyclaceae bacterium]